MDLVFHTIILTHRTYALFHWKVLIAPSLKTIWGNPASKFCISTPVLFEHHHTRYVCPPFVHRFGRRQRGKPRPIVVKFLYYKELQIVKEHAYQLKGKPYGINEQFPAVIEERRRRLYPTAKRLRLGGHKTKMVRDKLFVDGRPYDETTFTDGRSYRDVVQGSTSEPRQTNQSRQIEQPQQSRVRDDGRRPTPKRQRASSTPTAENTTESELRHDEIFFPVLFVLLMAMIKAFSEPKSFSAVSFPENPLANGKADFNTSNKLLVSPNTLHVEGLMTEVSRLLGGIEYKLFPNQSAAEEQYIANPKAVAAGIIYGFRGGTNWNYAIRMPYRSLPTSSDMFTQAQNQGQCRKDPNGIASGTECQANQYLTTGFVWLQNAIDTALIKQLNPAFRKPNVSVQLMPKDTFTESLDDIQIGSTIYIVLAYSFFINFLCVNLVAEKEKKIREGMKMMGLRDSVWWLSWTIVYVVVILFVTVLVVIITMVTSFFSNNSLLIFFITLFLYGLSIINLAFVMTPFFKKAQVAGIVAGFSTIAISLLHFIVNTTRKATLSGYDYSISPSVRWALCLLSPVSFALAMDQGIYLDIVKGGMTFSTITMGEFPMYAPIMMLLLDSVLYLFLAVYFDHVIPGEYGPRYKPWFCFTSSYWFGQKKTKIASTVDEGDNITLQEVDHILEPVSADLAKKVGIRISNISKVFIDKKTTVTAVDELTLNIYEDQITALLGHNGAGKTTLINMLCGLSPPTSGTATINGMDVSHSRDMETIRSMTGVCPQHDILYDDLTCREHLSIFAGIKAVKDEDKDAVETIMNAVDIIDQADMFSKNLSGGQKRKLSVAIALIGDPKMLILDEPTAGMDSSSRRHLWSLLKNLKDGKIILLTTHFMDEADILADRKAIINHGRLKCSGSSLFLKQRFGIGYHLNGLNIKCFSMVVNPECDAQKVTTLLKQHVSGIEMKRSHGKELAFTMPMAEVNKFPGSGRQENENTDSSSENRHYSIPMPNSDETVKLTSQQFWTLLKIRLKLKIRNTAALVFQILIPIILVIVGCILSKDGTTEDKSVTEPVTIKPFYVVPNEVPFLAIDSADTLASKSFIHGLERIYDVHKVNASVNISELSTYWMGVNVRDIKANMGSTYTALYNDSAIHSLPAVINVISNGLLAFAENITVSSLMWPSVLQSVQAKLSYNPNAFSAAFVLAVAFVVVPAGFSVEIVADRQIPSFSPAGAMLSLVLLFAAYVPANLLLSYVVSFAFSKFETCQAVLPNVFIFSGIIPYIVISLMDMLGQPDVAQTIHYTLCVIDPPYIIFGGIYYIDRISRVSDILQKPITFDMYFEWNNNIIYAIVMSLFHIELMIILLRIVDMYSRGRNLASAAVKHCKSQVQDVPEENIDIPVDEESDVTEERQRVYKLQSDEDKDMVPVAYIKNLRKEFKKRGRTCHQKKENLLNVAVRNVTFAVNKGEVFGLLGPNGAGKTTTLNMITAEISATRGKIIVAGHNVHSSTSKAFQALGYCPQHDALWDSITLKEHLEYYAAIKGIPKGQIESLINHYIENLKVGEHADKKAKKLSGGTRRKVSYAMSMLGTPQVVLLDEPSTGMDPQSKRFLWDTISSSFKSSERGAILTTHYMEEADALCSRVAILVNGHIKCLGSTQHLKDKFGRGYLLEIKLQNTTPNIQKQMDKLESRLVSLFPEIECLERFAERGWYRIAKSKTLLSEAFSVLEEMKSSHSVEEYSFSQSTLEQVFLDFAKHQKNEEIDQLE
ncbi:cholesterol transporter ABCA5-like [Gigantopelta aegis]|uniref:cholesterol transporter ABCA5-like n=1 Tax=Gigantopelta aegis TaxID=1735272 RepID=UPI001B887904|nr:cholesterol transporter ABCA5-like [Gigantopelta aegis]